MAPHVIEKGIAVRDFCWIHFNGIEQRRLHTKTMISPNSRTPQRLITLKYLKSSLSGHSSVGHIGQNMEVEGRGMLRTGNSERSTSLSPTLVQSGIARHWRRRS